MSKSKDPIMKKPPLLKFSGDMINALLQGLEQLDPKVRMRIMEKCGDACAKQEYYGPALDIARKIAEEETDLNRITERVNREILWCGTWINDGDIIHCTCQECGCPMVKYNVVKLRGILCYCSRGWVKAIFETLLKKPVRVELEKARGFGDQKCRYVVHIRD